MLITSTVLSGKRVSSLWEIQLIVVVKNMHLDISMLDFYLSIGAKKGRGLMPITIIIIRPYWYSGVDIILITVRCVSAIVMTPLFIKILNLFSCQFVGEQIDGSTSLLRAARSGNVDRVLDLLTNGKVDINTTNAVCLTRHISNVA